MICEPIVKEGDQEHGLRADWGARGFWEPQKMSLFDVCILNPDSDSLRGQALSTIFETRRNKKKASYSEAAEQRRATFTPFIATCNAVLDREAESYIKRLALFLPKNGLAIMHMLVVG